MSSSKPVYRQLSGALEARKRCAETGNNVWYVRWCDIIKSIMDTAPSGSGIDHGTTLDEERSNASKLVFTADFHHMNDGGYYDGWTSHIVTVTPSFSGIEISVSGRNRNDIKDYLADTFHTWLNREVLDDGTTIVVKC